MSKSDPANEDILNTMRNTISPLPPSASSKERVAQMAQTNKNLGEPPTKPKRYPLDALQRMASLDSIEVDLALYPETSIVGKLTCGDSFDLEDLTDTEFSASFSSLDDEDYAFDIKDYRETQQVLESLEVERQYTQGLQREKSPHRLPFQPEDLTETDYSACSAEDYGIEVSRGVFQELRGIRETYKALETGQCTEITCLFCDIRLVCVKDCDCVLCPQCQSMSPIEAKPTGSGLHIGGVGVGIHIE